MDIDQGIAAVNQRIQQAIRSSGRRADSVKLIAVSKTHPVEVIRAGFAAGLTRFGENRVHEAEAKIQVISEPIEWHMIGHLQSNKARTAVRLFDVIHSVDTVRLIREINGQAEKIGKTQPILVQVNVSGEASKSGVSINDLPELVRCAAASKNLRLLGLMTIPPFSDNPEHSRPFMKRLRELAFEELVMKRYVDERMLELSMGMSHDFEVAIEEGATMIRVGTALFGSRSLDVTGSHK